MRTIGKLLVPLVILSSGVCEAQEALWFSAVLRIDDSLPHVVQADVELNSSHIVKVDETYSIEFVAPNDTSEEARVTVRLLESVGDGYNILHASNQNLVDQKVRHVGYQVCGGKLVFLSPSPEFPPVCNG
jgi:hypothetical protein